MIQSNRPLFIAYIATLLLIGLGYLAMMPAFEGFDEYAHYSSLREIADTGSIPILGKAKIDQGYFDYAGPLPYGHDAPPFDSDLTYKKFFEQLDLAALYQQTYRSQPYSIPYRASDKQNWQAQHPPLYYYIMAGIYRALGNYSLVTQIFILRFVSFLLAIAGVTLGWLATHNSENERQAQLGFLLYPVMLPMFFAEFTRIGNDALCVFLIGALAFFLSRWRRNENVTYSFAIGIILGLGLLTKAFFVPITAGLAFFLSLRLWRDHDAPALRPKRIVYLITMFYSALFIGGGWYLYNAVHFGAISGVDSVQLAQQGGIVQGLREHFSLHNGFIGILAAFSSFVWAGTWSSVALPFRFRIALFIFVVVVFVASLCRIWRKPLTDFAWLPMLIFVLFLAGLFYHLLIGLALDGRGQTPAWYLHVLMPLIAPMIGTGVYTLLHKPATRLATIAILIYAAFFQILVLWCQFTLFTGCATKSNDVRYKFPDHQFCLDQFSMLANRLAVLAMPIPALGFFAGGIIGALSLIMLWRKTYNSSPL